MEQQQDDASAAGGQSRSTAVLEMRQPQEILNAMQKIAEAAEKSAVVPRRDVAPDDAVWLNIYCAVANCFNSEKHQAVAWADAGLAEFKKRFQR